MLLATTVVEASHASPWVTVGEVLTGLAALGTFLWAILRDKKKDKDQQGVNAALAVDSAIKAFDELVGKLQEEVTRLSTERDNAELRAQQRETQLMREVSRLRAEVRMLRQEIEKHGVVPPKMVWADDDGLTG